MLGLIQLDPITKIVDDTILDELVTETVNPIINLDERAECVVAHDYTLVFRLFSSTSSEGIHTEFTC